MKKLLWPLILLAAVTAIVLSLIPRRQPTEKVYVAVEGDNTIAVIDPARQKMIKKIDLSIEHDGGLLPYAPHNVEVSPDGQSVWVTANAGSHQDHAVSFLTPPVLAHGDEVETSEDDEIIIIDPITDKISARQPLGKELHLAHVVLTPDSRYAYVTAQEAGKIYKINTRALTVEKIISAPAGSEPHGLRIAPDGQTAYVAMLGSKSLGVLDLASDQIVFLSLGGQAVQTGVTPDGRTIMASLYDTKQLALYDPETKKLSFINLGNDSAGPIQMYPTPDSRFAYVADQGYYFNQPTGEAVLKIDLTNRQITKRIVTGKAPHGVVVSPSGNFVYVTNLLDGDVAAISTVTDEVIWKAAVGKEPNGISNWPGQPIGK